MITISVCMIVKNEEACLERCLNSLLPVADEIVIVDTGSTDRTREIALKYTDKVYDFKWINDFSAARNFAFSKCSSDYIYSADADEIIDENNLKEFMKLKAVIDPMIEIVQFIYDNPKDVNMAYNDLQELRPKLYKRLRTFRWIDPIHEVVATEPLVFDSDIVIQHRPAQNHSGRDFEAFLRLLNSERTMSARLYSMYAKELFFSGNTEDFEKAYPWFKERAVDFESFEGLEALCVVSRFLILTKQYDELMELEKSFTNFLYKPAEIDYTLYLMYEALGNAEKAHGYLEASKLHESFVCVTYRA